MHILTEHVIDKLQAISEDDTSSVVLTDFITEAAEELIVSSPENRLPVFGDLGKMSAVELLANDIHKVVAFALTLRHIQHLDLSQLGLKHLPLKYGSLSHITHLNISCNHLRALPTHLPTLPNLTVLNACYNNISSLPSSIARLEHLQVLALAYNELSSIPEELRQLQNLKELYLHHNDLGLPPEILGILPKTYKPLPTDTPRPHGWISPDILKNYPVNIHLPHFGIPWHDIFPDDSLQATVEPESVTTPKDILDFYFRPQERKRLNEAKLLLVGQGGVGKTSLLKRLIDNSFNLHESKTQGINIEHIFVKRRLPLIPLNTFLVDNTAAALPLHEDESINESSEEFVRLNIWDFGGQEIMHSTHQFFLTKRSIYILMLDARAGEKEGNLHYWLEMIAIYGRHSPLLIVVNKCDEHHEKLDENRIRLDYADKVEIVGFHYISCKTGSGIDDLRVTIEDELCSLSHVSDLLPIDYFVVKKHLESLAKSKDFISEDEYRAICKDYHVVLREDQTRLLRFLHDLGCILHYDDPNQTYQLRDTRVLNPEWVTSAVYRILNNATLLRNSDGILDREQLDEILNPSNITDKRYPRDRQQFLIEIMKKYELCIEFDNDSTKVLIPELLSKNEPDVGWISARNTLGDYLDFQIHYNILPRGLIPRFIVRAQHLLSEKRTCWRAGCVLHVEGSRVLIRGDIRTARVYIQVQSKKNRRAALALVRGILQTIHLTYGDIGAEEKVPLPLDPTAPAVDYEYLLQQERDGVIEQRFEKAKRRYNIHALLNGIELRKYHLFLSYNRNDLNMVRELRTNLESLGIKCWMDELNLTPGKPWQPELAEALQYCEHIAAIIGPSGGGPWQNVEIQSGMTDAIRTGKKIIPILLPGSEVEKAFLKESSFLKIYTYINFCDGFTKEQLYRLVKAVKSDR